MVCFSVPTLPERMRDLAVEVIIQRWRQNDSDCSVQRLAEHFGLYKPIKLILGDTKIFEDIGSVNLPIISLKDTYKRFLEKA